MPKPIHIIAGLLLIVLFVTCSSRFVSTTSETNPPELSPQLLALQGTWELWNPTGEGLFLHSYMTIDEYCRISFLTELEGGSRRRSDFILSERNDSLFTGSSYFQFFPISVSRFRCNSGVYNRRQQSIDPDAWFHFISAEDSIPICQSDIASYGDYVYQMRRHLVRYRSSPLELADTLTFIRGYPFDNIIEVDAYGLWAFRDSSILCFDLETGDTLFRGPEVLHTTGIASNDTTIWYMDDHQRKIYSFTPPSMEIHEWVDFENRGYTIGSMTWYQGSIIICQHHNLYRYSVETGELQAVYGYRRDGPLWDERNLISIEAVSSAEDGLWAVVNPTGRGKPTRLCKIVI